MTRAEMLARWEIVQRLVGRLRDGKAVLGDRVGDGGGMTMRIRQDAQATGLVVWMLMAEEEYLRAALTGPECPRCGALAPPVDATADSDAPKPTCLTRGAS